MNRAFLFGVLALALVIAALTFLGLSKIAIVAVMAALWLVLTVGLSFVGDRRYAAASGAAHDRSTGEHEQPRLTIGRAILIGELVVNVPVLALFVSVIPAVATLAAYAMGGAGVRGPLPALIALTVAFVAAWMWWAIVTPRWLLWAMRRVSDPRTLKAAAIGSILWPDQGWGAIFNRTQWRSEAMEIEERNLLATRTGRRA
jgi:hypothetical protein